MLDDIDLIRKYLRQESALLSNPQLRVQAVDPTAVQLITRQGQLLATADFTGLAPQVTIRPGSTYADLLHEMLVAHHFLPKGQCDDNSFDCYVYHPVPEDYVLHVTPAGAFWKEWWARYRSLPPGERGGSQTDIMLFTQNKWYPVRDVISDRGTLFIKTWVDETGHTSEDQLVWLSKIEPTHEDAEKTQFFFPQTAAEKAHIMAQAPPQRQVTSPPPQPPAPNLQQHPAPTRPPTRSHPQAQPHPQAGRGKPRVVDFKGVVRYHRGKLYIQTALGEIRVEGDNLTYALLPKAATSTGRSGASPS